jgi:hypothetical protein
VTTLRFARTSDLAVDVDADLAMPTLYGVNAELPDCTPEKSLAVVFVRPDLPRDASDIRPGYTIEFVFDTTRANHQL